MKNHLKLIFSFALFLILFSNVSYPLNASVSFVSGDGSESHPYLISSAEQLDAIRYDLNAHYALMNDVDLSLLLGTMVDLNPLTNNGLGWLPIGDSSHPFTGSLDGRGHTISGLVFYIPESDANTYELGLFGGLDGAILYNLDIEGDALIEHSEFVALGLLAPVSSDATLSGLNVSGTITLFSETSSIIGGLIAEAQTTSFNNLDVNINIQTHSSNNSGGLVGYSDSNQFHNVVNRGDVHAFRSEYVGGIAGYSQDSVYDSVRNHGDITGYDFTGGIVGWARRTSMLGVLNKGDIVTNTYHVGGIIGKLDDDHASTFADDYPLTFLLNEGSVTSLLQTEDAQVGGLIGMIEINDYSEDDVLHMRDLVDLGTSHPLVGLIQESLNGNNLTILLRRSRSTSNVAVLTENTSLGSISIVDESTYIEPNDLDEIALALNEQGYEMEASVISNDLVIEFVMNVYFTQGKINGATSNHLMFFNTYALKVLPHFSAFYVPSFEDMAQVVSWDFTTMIGWNINQQDTGDFFYPEDEFVYVSDRVFIRLFATDIHPDDVEDEVSEEGSPVDEEEEELPFKEDEPLVDEEEPSVDEEEIDEQDPPVDEEEINEGGPDVDEEEVNEDVLPVDEEDPIVDDEDNEKEVDEEEESLPDTSDSKSWGGLLLGLGLLALALSKKTKH